jgi:aconitate hydratase
VELHAVPASLPLPTRRHAEPDGPRDGAVVIAALTSCTNTSHPASMITAGLVARRAMRAGLRVPPWVKTSLAPGSRAVPDYLRRAGVLPALEELGFGVVAFGCTTCHGMSGPLNPAAERAVREDDVLGVAVLSGNRNFEGRIHPQVRAAYLASPGLVVSYALAGSVRVDLTSEPLGRTPEGAEVFLRDLWPAPEEVAEVVRQAVTPDLHRPGSSTQDERWHALPVPGGELFDWSASSTYLLEPPYIDGLAGIGADLLGARPLLVLGDDVSTDHLSPVGAIAPDSEAGRYLVGAGVPEQEFNSFGARRGNHHVMVRGTFGSPRLRNALAAGREGPVTRYEPSGELMSVHAAAEAYRARGVPLVVVAGDRYGCGSARDWAAKGTRLLGVRVVLARGFERIHRSNLVGMGVLPVLLPDGTGAGHWGIEGSERFDFLDLSRLRPRGEVTVRIHRADGSSCTFTGRAAVDTGREVEYLRRGGVLACLCHH